MWRPGFPYEESVCATLTGAHRSLCIYSVRHRGCFKRPGLVLGLDIGGRCQGLAFRVSPGHERRTRQYLRSREQSTLAYKEVLRQVQLEDDTGRQVRAICYMANRNHTQYAGITRLESQADMIRNSSGKSGHNMEYYFNTVRHLKELGIVDKPFFRLSNYLAGGIRKIT